MCVRANGQLSGSFAVISGVRQGCVLAPDAFNTGMDWVLGRATHRSMCGTAIGACAFSDLDYADDVALLGVGDPYWMGLVLDETPMLFLSNIVFKTPQLYESVRFILNFYVT